MDGEWATALTLERAICLAIISAHRPDAGEED
jgi:hypothetical protein